MIALLFPLLLVRKKAEDAPAAVLAKGRPHVRSNILLNLRAVFVYYVSLCVNCCVGLGGAVFCLCLVVCIWAEVDDEMWV